MEGRALEAETRLPRAQLLEILRSPRRQTKVRGHIYGMRLILLKLETSVAFSLMTCPLICWAPWCNIIKQFHLNSSHRLVVSGDLKENLGVFLASCRSTVRTGLEGKTHKHVNITNYQVMRKYHLPQEFPILAAASRPEDSSFIQLALHSRVLDKNITFRSIFNLVLCLFCCLCRLLAVT